MVMTQGARKAGVDAPTFWVGVLYGAVVCGLALIAFFVFNPFAGRNSDALAAKFDVTIEWVDLPTCGDAIDVLGCFRYTNPDTIYLKSGLTGDLERYVILHEIGHVLQHRLGIDADECAADRFAQSMGSELGYYCPPE